MKFRISMKNGKWKTILLTIFYAAPQLTEHLEQATSSGSDLWVVNNALFVCG